MGRLIYMGIVVIAAVLVLAWNSDIKPRIFSNPDAVSLKPSFKLGLLIYCGIFYGAIIVYLLLWQVLPESSPLRIALAVVLFILSVLFGKYFTKRSLRRIFYDCAISQRMNPEEYARTICPHFVVEFIDSHLHDKKTLEQFIKYQKKLRNISDQCAWAFLVAYCDKRP